MKSQTIPYELMIRFGWQTPEELGTVKTYQFTDAAAVTDDNGKLSVVPGSPVDMTQEQATKYLGEQFAGFAAQLDSERKDHQEKQAAAEQALSAAQAKAATELQTANEAAAITLKDTQDKATADKTAAVKVVQDQLDAANGKVETLRGQIADLTAKNSEFEKYGVTPEMIATRKADAVRKQLAAALQAADAQGLDVKAETATVVTAMDEAKKVIIDPPTLSGVADASTPVTT